MDVFKLYLVISNDQMLLGYHLHNAHKMFPPCPYHVHKMLTRCLQDDNKMSALCINKIHSDGGKYCLHTACIMSAQC